MTDIHTAIDALRLIGTATENSKYSCRAYIDSMGVKINMWTRTDDQIYADRNYHIGWEQLQHAGDYTVFTVFAHLEDYITKRIAAKRAQREVQNGN